MIRKDNTSDKGTFIVHLIDVIMLGRWEPKIQWAESVLFMHQNWLSAILGQGQSNSTFGV